jgi:hypothetical protein
LECNCHDTAAIEESSLDDELAMDDEDDDDDLPPVGFIFASDVKPRDLDAAEKAVSVLSVIKKD